MRIYTMERINQSGTNELVIINSHSTDIFINGVFKATKNTLFGNSEKSARVHYKNGFKMLGYKEI